MQEHETRRWSSRALLVAAAAAGLAVGALPSRAVEIQRPTRPSERWALIVGTDEEPVPDPEHGVTQQQRAIAESLRTAYGYRPSHVTELYAETATADGIREAMSRMLAAMKSSDTLFAFLSLPTLGEGPEGYFIPSGGKREEPWTLLPAFALDKILRELPARTSLLTFPSCAETSPANAGFFQHLAYAQRTGGTVWLLTVCGSRDAPSPRTDFARSLREALELVSTARAVPALSRADGSLAAGQLMSGLQQASFRAQLTNFPPSSREEFVFTLEASRLAPYLARLHDDTPNAREVAIDSLVRAVLSEPVDTRGGLSREAGEALVAIAQEPSGSTRYRAVAALAEIGYGPAAPVLGELLARSEDAALRQAVVEGLAKLGGAEALPHLQRALSDPAPVVRMAAIRALGARGEESSLEALRNAATSDAVEDVRLAALQALTSFKGREAAVREVASVLLGDSSPGVRREAASALGSLGKSRVTPQLLGHLRTDPVASVRQAAAYSVARSFDEGDRAIVQKALGEASEDGDAGVRQAAAWALGEIGAADLEPRLQHLLEDGDPAVRRSAAEALGKLSSTKSLPKLVVASRDRAPEVRQAAVGALGRIGGPTATNALLAAVNDENVYVKVEAEKALRTVPGATRELLAGLGSPSPRTRAEAAQKLGDTGDSRYVTPLVPLLGDTDIGVRRAAIAALARLRDDAALGPLLRALQDPNPAVRQGAVTVIGLQGRHEATDDLARLAKDPNPGLRAEVIRSLGKIDSGGVSTTVLAATSDPDASVRLAAAEALAGTPSPEAREALQRLARDASPQVRQKAIEVLGYAGKN